jgi:hypothetical protein
MHKKPSLLLRCGQALGTAAADEGAHSRYARSAHISQPARACCPGRRAACDAAAVGRSAHRTRAGAALPTRPGA